MGEGGFDAESAELGGRFLSIGSLFGAIDFNQIIKLHFNQVMSYESLYTIVSLI